MHDDDHDNDAFVQCKQGYCSQVYRAADIMQLSQYDRHTNVMAR